EPAGGAPIITGDQPPQVLKGLVSGSATLVGTLSPLVLDVSGQIKGHEVDVLQRHVGDLAAELTGFVNSDRVDLRTSTLKLLDGDATLKDVHATGFVADQVTATTTLRNGQFAIAPIRLQRGDGRGELHAAINLNDVRHLTAGAALTAWPIDVPGSFAHVDAWVD